jgi:RNA polymerase I-specific transcription initiation factor RRN3
MPVRSPTLNASVANEPMNQDLAKNASPTLSEKEETNENVSKEKLANMRLMMKTFVMGALREKEQVNYFISCT